MAGINKNILMKAMKSKKFFIIVGVVVVAIGAVAFLWAGSNTAVTEGIAEYKVTRSDLKITVLEQGDLQAKSSTRVTPEIKRNAKISYIIPEGTRVENGDVLFKLDTSELEEQLKNAEIQFESAQSDLVQAQENLKIQEMENESSLNRANLKVELAKLQLDQYTLGDSPKNLRQAQLKVSLAESRLKRAKDTFEHSKALIDKGFVTQNQYEEDRIALEEAEANLETAKIELNNFKTYTDPINLKQKQSDHDEAIAELERVKKVAESNLAQKKAVIRQRQLTFDSRKETLESLKKEQENMVVKAPTPGVVIYGDDRDRRQETMQVGTSVFYGKIVVTLPNLSEMIVTTNVNEVDVSKVTKGLPATVKVDAVPGKVFSGEVSKVAPIPNTANRWMANDTKEYAVEITLDKTVENLTPGMSAQVEIKIDTLKNVISVPVQAVYEIDQKMFVFVKTSNSYVQRQVRLGRSNQLNLEIVEGLESNEIVALARPGSADVKAVELLEGFEEEQTDEETASPQDDTGQVQPPFSPGSFPAGQMGPSQSGDRTFTPGQGGDFGNRSFPRPQNGEGTSGSFRGQFPRTDRTGQGNRQGNFERPRQEGGTAGEAAQTPDSSVDDKTANDTQPAADTSVETPPQSSTETPPAASPDEDTGENEQSMD